MDCGAACLSTVCKFYGKDVSINTTRPARVKQEGASLTNLLRALNEMGFRPEAFVSSVDQLKEKKLPAIANWKGYHWIVVNEVTEKRLFVDPAEGLVHHTHEEFISVGRDTRFLWSQLLNLQNFRVQTGNQIFYSFLSSF